MKLLLDTHLLLWASEGAAQLSPAARALISDPANELIFSVASLWEVAIKHSRGLPEFQVDPVLLRNSLLQNGFNELEIVGRHAVAVSTLPLIHRDPFDRLLVVQAMIEGITLLTADRTLTKYPGPIRMV